MRFALVTGASRGIGRAIAIELAKDNCLVGINFARNRAAAENVVGEIENSGGRALLAPFDVANEAAVEAAIKTFVANVGGLDVLVNNAGISIDGLAMRVAQKDWQTTLDVNLSGTFYCCKHASRSLLKSTAGRIINLSSVVAEQGNPGQASYAASKAGLIGLTRALAREYASRGVTVNCVSPGYIATEMTAPLLTEERKAAVLRRIPLGRIGTPEDVADAVRFLASEEASYITGQVVRVNGGLLM